MLIYNKKNYFHFDDAFFLLQFGKNDILKRTVIKKIVIVRGNN